MHDKLQLCKELLLLETKINQPKGALALKLQYSNNIVCRLYMKIIRLIKDVEEDIKHYINDSLSH